MQINIRSIHLNFTCIQYIHLLSCTYVSKYDVQCTGKTDHITNDTAYTGDTK